MGVKSTYYIDRATALDVIKSRIDICTNEQLAEILEEVDVSRFRNFTVSEQLYEQLPDKDVDWAGEKINRTIRDVGDFLSGK